MRLLPVLLALLACAVPRAGAALDPAAVPSPRPTGWVVDRADLLSPAAEAEIHRLGEAVHQCAWAELLVVTLPTLEGADPRRFATALFNRWGVGSAGRDNGILLLVARDDRAAEIILGDGLDSADEVAASESIMQGRIVPRFRAGDPEAGILHGTRALVARFFPDVAPLGPENLDLERPNPAPAGDFPPDEAAPPAAAARATRLAVGAGGLTVAGVLGWLLWRLLGRRRPRRCPRCAREMSRLDEVADDAHLSASEQLEEKLGSVDYDIWHCPWCEEVQKVRHGRWFTRYARCPQCGAVTASEIRTTLRPATTILGGLVRIDESCAQCDFRRSHTRVTPRLRDHDDGGSGGGRSRGGFSGGGRSSGRGSSGRW